MPIAHKAMLGSVAFMAIGQALDFQSSMTHGNHEMNPLLRGSDGGFSPAKGISLKIGLVGGLSLGEYLVHKTAGHGADKAFTVVNTSMGALGVAAAISNSSVPKGK
jgi:hypothetical protein